MELLIKILSNTAALVALAAGVALWFWTVLYCVVRSIQAEGTRTSRAWAMLALVVVFLSLGVLFTLLDK